MKRTEKSLFVQNLAEELKSAASVVLVDYSGMSVKVQQELKKRLKKVDATMSVVKNTLFKLAGEKSNAPKQACEDAVLKGPRAMIITESDPLAPLSILAKFAKEFNVPQLKVGIIEGCYQDKAGLIELAKLPSKQALFAQAVGTISAPVSALLYTMQAKMQDLISILKQASDKGK